MARIVVIGGGLAGLASAAALGGAGHSVVLLESRPFLGGRATSYEVGNGDEAEFIDNCQHILLRCCVNLLDFYERLNTGGQIQFQVFNFPGNDWDFIFEPPDVRTDSILRFGVL